MNKLMKSYSSTSSESDDCFVEEENPALLYNSTEESLTNSNDEELPEPEEIIQI